MRTQQTVKVFREKPIDFRASIGNPSLVPYLQCPPPIVYQGIDTIKDSERGSFCDIFNESVKALNNALPDGCGFFDDVTNDMIASIKDKRQGRLPGQKNMIFEHLLHQIKALTSYYLNPNTSADNKKMLEAHLSSEDLNVCGPGISQKIADTYEKFCMTTSRLTTTWAHDLKKQIIHEFATSHIQYYGLRATYHVHVHGKFESILAKYNWINKASSAYDYFSSMVHITPQHEILFLNYFLRQFQERLIKYITYQSIAYLKNIISSYQGENTDGAMQTSDYPTVKKELYRLLDDLNLSGIGTHLLFHMPDDSIDVFYIKASFIENIMQFIKYGLRESHKQFFYEVAHVTLEGDQKIMLSNGALDSGLYMMDGIYQRGLIVFSTARSASDNFFSQQTNRLYLFKSLVEMDAGTICTLYDVRMWRRQELETYQLATILHHKRKFLVDESLCRTSYHKIKKHLRILLCKRQHPLIRCAALEQIAKALEANRICVCIMAFWIFTL